MTTSAFKGGITFERATGGSPAYSTVPECKSISGFGKTNPLIDATSFDSTAREYIAGLADGSEITLEHLRVHSSPSVQDLVIADVDAGSTVGFRLTVTDGTTAKTYTFNAVCLGWSLSPSYEDANMISFTLKISGAITAA